MSKPAHRGNRPGTPTELALIGRIGGLTTASRYDGREITAKARATFRASFEREVDPDGTLPEPERLRRAEAARRAHYARLGLASARARRKARSTRRPDSPLTPTDGRGAGS
jgi:hypothetical protein